MEREGLSKLTTREHSGTLAPSIGQTRNTFNLHVTWLTVSQFFKRSNLNTIYETSQLMSYKCDRNISSPQWENHGKIYADRNCFRVTRQMAPACYLAVTNGCNAAGPAQPKTSCYMEDNLWWQPARLGCAEVFAHMLTYLESELCSFSPFTPNINTDQFPKASPEAFGGIRRSLLSIEPRFQPTLASNGPRRRKRGKKKEH